jgi:hypothetical protein
VFVPRSSYNAALKVINESVNPFIDEVLSLPAGKVKTGLPTPYTFLHELAEFTQDRKLLRDQIIAVLLASRDTTASALSWTMYELARHPHVTKRLRQEIFQVVGGIRSPTYVDLKNMKYLQVRIDAFSGWKYYI